MQCITLAVLASSVQS